MSPNPTLAEKYNTGDVERNRNVVSSISKEASDVQWGMGLLGAGIALAMMQQARRKGLESDVMEHRMAASERERLYPVSGSLRHTRAPVIIPSAMSPMVPVGMDEGMVRIAAAIGSDMATMEKEAFLGIGAAAKGVGNLMKGVGRGMTNKVVSPIKSTGGAMLTGARQKMEQFGAKMTDVGNKAMGAPTDQLSKMRSMHANQNLVGSAMSKPTPKPMQASGLQPAKPAAQMPAAPPAAPPTNVNTASGAAPAAPSNTVDQKPGLLQRSGLFNEQGKLRTGRLLGAGALMGAGYLGYKGISSGMDWMQQHPHNANYNLGGNQVPMGVNQYGYPQF